MTCFKQRHSKQPPNLNTRPQTQFCPAHVHCFVLQLEVVGDSYVVTGGLLNPPSAEAGGFATAIEQHDNTPVMIREHAGNVMQFALGIIKIASQVSLCARPRCFFCLFVLTVASSQGFKVSALVCLR